MIVPQPGDLVAVQAHEKYYYAIILERIRLFGGNWTFVFHRTSAIPLTSVEILAGPRAGFHAYVDFMWAKKEGRLTRIERKVDTSQFAGPGSLKSANDLLGPVRGWFISDMEFKPVRRVIRLSEEEKRYPLNQRIDDVGMVRMVDTRWTPENDERLSPRLRRTRRFSGLGS